MQKIINKSDFINNLADNCENINHLKVDDAVREILGMMAHYLVNDGRIEVRGFGSFSLHHRKPRVGRNPKTGEQVAVAARAIPHFKPGKALREAVNDSI
ncbi:MAG: integration host factor subunit beta [Gammaproteobacteria bacterium]|nr:MAG: integration host factor subunit beta [Gammaproteobacteria bacterium]